MSTSKRAQAHNWAEKALFSQDMCFDIATNISIDPDTADCNEREVKEGIIHAWRAFRSGCTSERAVARGILHAIGLRQARTPKIRKKLY